MKLLKSFLALILFVIYLQTSTCILNDVIEQDIENNVDVQPRGLIDDFINGIIKKVMVIIDAMDDPLTVLDKSFQIPTNPSINGLLGLNNLTISNFKSINISASLLSLTSLYFKVELPKLQIYLDYENNLQLGVPDTINNKGTVDLVLEELVINGTATISIDIGWPPIPKIVVNSTDAHIDLEKINASLTGFLNDDELSEILGPIVSDTAITWLHNYQEPIDGFVSSTATDIINKVLQL